MPILGIETSCDETGCGIVDESGAILSHLVASQVDVHAVYGGVVPEIAARAHLETLGPLVRRCLMEAQLDLQQIDRIVYTRGPGLVGALLVGATFAQGLAKSLGIPSHGLHHLEGHLGAAYLADQRLEPPFIVLVASGGHTELLLALPGFRYRMLGRTRDDAAGEAFDKSGKLLGLGYPAGPILSMAAKNGNRKAYALPRAFLEKSDQLEFSFSGLKSAVARLIQSIPPDELLARRADLCASVEEAIVDVLVSRTLQAVQAHGVTQVAVVGGVAANRRLRERLHQVGEREGFLAVFPKPSLCGDNGVMMAAIGWKRAQADIWPESQAVLPTMAWDGMEEVGG
jgi:N6-L-threonylcarbamoyladenine synthase